MKAINSVISQVSLRKKKIHFIKDDFYINIYANYILLFKYFNFEKNENRIANNFDNNSLRIKQI